MSEQPTEPMAADEPEPAATLTAREAATRLGVDERTVRRAIARGELPAAKRAGAYRIAPADLERYRGCRTGRGPEGTPTGVPAPADAGRRHLIALPARPLAAAAALPIAPNPLVGREDELAALVAALRDADVRLLTLTGPGGVGKTRLALAAAAEAADDFPDGIYFVNLAPVREPALVAPAIAQVLGVREAGAEPIATRLASVLRDQRLLLVLDNFEQVVEAGPVVARLLAAGPFLKALVTSRTRLRVSGERERPVEPLGLAGSGGRPSATRMSASAAVRLFVARVQALREEFALTDENAPAVAAICRRLDGLPLAIELAAARAKMMPPATLLAQLDRRLPLLTGGARDQPDRLRTMRDAIAWSHDLLTPAEQALLRRLAVFIGGLTLDAAEWVLGEDGADGSPTTRKRPATRRAMSCSRRSTNSPWSNWRRAARRRSPESVTPAGAWPLPSGPARGQRLRTPKVGSRRWSGNTPTSEPVLVVWPSAATGSG
jgi:excisionase family DNA binding protein